MTWTRLSDDLADGPALLRVSRSARLLHVEALIYCNRHLTDGVLPVAALRRISDAEDLDADAAELEAAGLWSRDEDRRWQIDWTDQEPAEKVRKRRADNAERQDRSRRHHREGDHSKCLPKSCATARNALRDASRNAPSNDAPSPPGPTRREGRGGGGDSASGGRSAARSAASAAPPSEPHVEPSWFNHGPPEGVPIYIDKTEVSAL